MSVLYFAKRLTCSFVQDGRFASNIARDSAVMGSIAKVVAGIAEKVRVFLKVQWGFDTEKSLHSKPSAFIGRIAATEISMGRSLLALCFGNLLI